MKFNWFAKKKCPRPDCGGDLYVECDDYNTKYYKCNLCSREFNVFGVEPEKPIGAGRPTKAGREGY